MTWETILSVLWSPVGLGAVGAGVLGLLLHVAPSPRRPVRLEWSLACFGAAAVMVATAASMCGIWDAWQTAGVVLMCAVTLAVGGFWLAQAPLPCEFAGRERDVDRSIAADDGGRSELATDTPPRLSASSPIDWDAFDRVRQQWAGSRESDPR